MPRSKGAATTYIPISLNPKTAHRSCYNDAHSISYRSTLLSDKARTNHLRRLARRAGLRVATLQTEAGRVFAVIERQRIVALCVGHAEAARQLVAKQQVAA